MRVRKVRSALTTVGIILGVAVILGISITNLSTIAAFRETIDSITGRADFWINAPSNAGFDQRYLRKVRGVKGVAAAIPGVTRGSRLVKGSDDKITLQIVGIDPAVDRKLREYKVNSGRFLKRKDRRVVLLVDKFASDHRVGLGDHVTLVTDAGFVRFKVVGLIAGQGAGRFVGGDVAFMPLGTAQKEFGLSNRLSFIDAQADGGNTVIIEKRIKRVLGGSFIVEQPEKRVESFTETLSALRIGLSFFSAVALFVGGFLIYNTLSMVVVERTRELGMLRGLGATRSQISRLILTEAAVLGVAGALLGVLLGIGLARGLLYFMSQTVGSRISVFQLPPLALITSVAVGIFVSLVAALQPALAASRISPIQALRSQGRREPTSTAALLLPASAVFLTIGMIASFRPQLFGATPGSLIGQAGAFLLMLGTALLTPILIRPLGAIFRPPAILLAGNDGRLAADNLGRVRGRTAATVSAIMISLAMLMSVGGMTDSFKDGVHRWVDRSIGADVLVAGKPNDLSFNKRFIEQLKNVPGVKIVSPIRFLQVRSGDSHLTYRAIDPATFRKMASLQFVEGSPDTAWRRLRGGGAVFISTVLANRLNARVGDTLTIKTKTGDKPFRVAGVIVDFGGDMGDVAVGTFSDMKHFFDLDDANVFRIKATAGVRPEALAREIKKRFSREFSLEIQDAQEFRTTVDNQINVTFAAFNVIILIAVLVAAVGIVNTLMMNVLERHREIGVLRAIGFTKWQVRRMVMVEATITGAAGFILGLVLGTFMSINVVQGMHALTGFDISYVFPVNIVLTSAVIALVFSTFVALLPAQVAARASIIEALQYE